MTMRDRYNELLEEIWRRELTPEEEHFLEKYLVEHPAAKSQWDLELQLARAVRAMPSLDPGARFTEAVIGKVRALSDRRVHVLFGHGGAFWGLRLWRIGFASALLVLGLVISLWFSHVTRVDEGARALAVVTEAISKVPIEAMADYDVIVKLSDIKSLPEPDYELLQLLQ